MGINIIMITLNMIGGGFQHDVCSSTNNVPKHVIWDKTTHSAPISVHIDDGIFNIPVDKSKLNIAWFSESPYFVRPLEQYLDAPYWRDYASENFKYIFTSDKDFTKTHPQVKYILPLACPWVKSRQMFPKSKTVSIIASWKKTAPGHKFRHIVIDMYKGYLDAYGQEYVPTIPDKSIALNDYMFSITIENTQANGYFTEKIADCFATGTIPIYWGDETISDYFLEEGIIRLNSNFDILSLTKDLYLSKLPAVRENLDRIIKFPCAEDYIYLTYLR